MFSCLISEYHYNSNSFGPRCQVQAETFGRLQSHQATKHQVPTKYTLHDDPSKCHCGQSKPLVAARPGDVVDVDLE